MRQGGLIIHPEELDEVWISELKRMEIPTLGLHPVGGADAADSFKAQIARSKDPHFRALVDQVTSAGIRVEYEMHALRYFLPASEFEKHPDWFRVDEKGERNPDRNCCVSNTDALDFIAERAAEAAKALYVGSSPSHRHFFWTDDSHDVFCHCKECSRLTPSEQQLKLMNAIASRLRKDDPLASQSFLAYDVCTEVPKKIEPADGVFLEVAPMNRDIHKPLSGSDDARNTARAKEIRELLACFGRENTKILDYWLDNSWFSGWKKPPKAFSPDVPVMKADIEFYHSLGIRDVTTFACYLGEDYRALYGLPDLGGFENMIR